MYWAGGGKHSPPPFPGANRVKGCNEGPKNACNYTKIAMSDVDKFLVDFSFRYLLVGRYRDDTFIPWLRGILTV